MSTLRLGTLFVALLVLALPEANACDLKAATKNTRAPGYVADVQVCLTNLPAGYSFDEAIEQDNISRVNQERQKRGLKPLLLREGLQSPARWHSMDMAANNYFSHSEKSRRTHADRISLLDRTLIYSVATENIAFMRGGDIAGKEPATLHQGLMDSDSHRAAILSEEVTHMAVGVVRHKNGVWLTQIFVNKMGEFLTPIPTKVGASDDLRFRVQLPEWTPTGFETRQKEDFKRFSPARGGSAYRVPAGVHGDFQLMVRGERVNEAIKSENPGKQYLLMAKISGPIMSVAPDSHTIETRKTYTSLTHSSVPQVILTSDTSERNSRLPGAS